MRCRPTRMSLPLLVLLAFSLTRQAADAQWGILM